MTSTASDAAIRARARALLTSNRAADVVALLAPLLARDPWDTATLELFAEAQLAWGNMAEAEAACRMVLERDPDRWTARRLLAHVLIERDRVPEALQAIALVVRQAPDDAPARHLYGVALQFSGRLADAKQQYRAVIDSNARAARTYLRLAELEAVTEESGLVVELEAALTATDPEAVDDRSSLHYALGKAYDDLRNWDRAFAHLALASRLRRATVEYSEAEALALIDRVQATFTPALLARTRPVHTDAIAPVFIVGMPRSGTTLLEQILSRHPRVRCIGESTAFAGQLARERRERPELPLFPELMTSLDERALERIARGYVAAVDAPPGAHVVNKQLGNLLFLGAIRMVFPGAKFVVAGRDAIDTCFSIYMRSFDNRLPYSHDLAELGRQWRRQHELLDYWLRVLPRDTVHVVRYEDLVDDIEPHVRALLSFLGLPWEPACLAFHESTQPVRTASSTQVRRPLYRSAVGRSAPYRHHLGALIDALQGRSAPARG